MYLFFNNVVDSWVGDVVVTDYDAGVNAQYDLRLVSQGPEEHFNLTSTGSIVTTAKLDREAIDTYYIIIEAKDKGTPRLSGSGTLTVSVQFLMLLTSTGHTRYDKFSFFHQSIKNFECKCKFECLFHYPSN